MTIALVALLLAAPCEHPAVQALNPEHQVSACALLAQPAAPAVDRASLEAVYQRAGFERARDRNTGAMQALLAQLRAWLESLFATSGAQTYSNVTRAMVLFLAVLAGLALALRFAARRRARTVAAPQRRAAALVLDAPDEHLARARKALAGDPRGAIREGLLALLSHLERARLARPDRVTTNRELAQQLPARGAPPALAESVARLVGWYDLAFYSLDPVPPDAARRFVDEVTTLSMPAAGGTE
jgi:hypothetical protein